MKKLINCSPGKPSPLLLTKSVSDRPLRACCETKFARTPNRTIEGLML